MTLTAAFVVVAAAVVVPFVFLAGCLFLTRGTKPTDRAAIIRAFGHAFAGVLAARRQRRRSSVK